MGSLRPDRRGVCANFRQERGTDAAYPKPEALTHGGRNNQLHALVFRISHLKLMRVPQLGNGDGPEQVAICYQRRSALDCG